MSRLRKRLWLLAALATLIVSTHAEAKHRRHHHHAARFAGPEGWSTYVSNDGGTSVEYPANVFSVKEEPNDQHRQTLFKTADSRGKMTVYSLPNERHDTPRSYLAGHLAVDRNQLTYRRIASAFFAMSGVKDDSIFYTRCNFEDVNGRIRCVYLEYPKEEKKAWVGIVTRISRSLAAQRR